MNHGVTRAGRKQARPSGRDRDGAWLSAEGAPGQAWDISVISVLSVVRFCFS